MADDDNTEVLMCARVADIAEPHVPSRQARCSRCGSRVWVSLRAPPIPLIMCTPCVMEIADDAEEFGVTEETLAEVAEVLARKP